MRITFLTHTPGRGGSTVLLDQLAGFFRSRGHSVSIVVGDDCENAMLDDYIVVPVKSGAPWSQRMQSYKETVESTRPEVAYSISGKDELDVHRFLSCPRVRHVSSIEQHEYVDIPFWIRQTDGFSEAVTTNTPDVLDAILSEIRTPCVGAVAPYRIASHYLRMQPLASPPRETVDVCFVGRLENFQKRSRWIPEIVSECKSRGAKISWHIYGDGPDRAWIEGDLHRRGCTQDVLFHGWADSATLARCLPNHDIFFLCSRWEGLPIAMVEAMLSGLAPVVPAIPAGITYILKNGGGVTYDSPSPATAAQALIAAAENKAELKIMKGKSRDVAQTLFNEEVVRNQLEELEKKLAALKFNGRSLKISSARELRAVTTEVFIKRKAAKAWQLLCGSK